MKDEEIQGSCLCGAVALSVRGLGDAAGVCHCGICRRWGGGPMFALACSELRFDDDAQIRTYDTTAWARRGFCGQCGTHLFIQVKPAGRYILPAGLFQVEDGLRFDHQIFIDQKPAYYSFANETKNLTGEEVFAAHAPPSES